VGGFKLVLSKREDDRHASLEERPKGLDWAKAAGRLSYPCHCEGAALPPEAVSCEVETFRIRRS
jgi:hypothetical protein